MSSDTRPDTIVLVHGFWVTPSWEGWIDHYEQKLGRAARSRDGSSVTGLTLTHIGGPTVLIEVGGWRILTDPTFDPPGRRYRFGWGTASTKVAGLAVTAADLGPIDAVLLTHDHHTDNLDDQGRSLLEEAGRVVTTESGARRLGAGACGLRAWERTTLEAAGRSSIEVTATPCRYGPPLSHPIVGDVIGFALTSPDLSVGALWISGDTVLYDAWTAATRSSPRPVTSLPTRQMSWSDHDPSVVR